MTRLWFKSFAEAARFLADNGFAVWREPCIVNWAREEYYRLDEIQKETAMGTFYPTGMVLVNIWRL